MKRWHVFGMIVWFVATAGGQEIGYIEEFSLATNRVEALRNLVPGTDDYYYFHALQAQHTGETAAFQKLMDRWILERKGTISTRARELLNRQALLEYEQDPDKTLAYLRDQIRPYTGHARKTGERRSDAPTKLNPGLIATDTILQTLLRSTYEDKIARIEDAGLEQVAALALATGPSFDGDALVGALMGDRSGFDRVKNLREALPPGQAPLSGEQRRNLLARLQRPDYPGLVDLIIDDLSARHSRAFGSISIHDRLTLAQMDELLQKKPDLRNQVAFVTAYLSKLGPEDEVDIETDLDARRTYFDRLWAFVGTLDPVHNSLKANVLYGRLRLDQQQGVYEEARFLEYVQLPRDVVYLTDEVRKALPRSDHMARLNQRFGLLQLPPVANEEPLVRDYLLHFFVEAETYEPYTPWIRDDFLKRLFAEAKITAGVGDPQQWAHLLTPEEYRRVKERVDIEFAPDNPVVIASDDEVQLTAFVKNVPELIVKVYDINTLNYYRETGRPLNLAINLDGLVASSERRVTYADSPELRTARTFAFPELKKRGAYVVELIGNGKSSRSLVQKGRLGVLQEATAAGHAFTVLDEANRPLPNARAWLGGREFMPDAKGRLLVPYSTDPGTAALVVYEGDFASLIRFSHQSEQYDLQADIYVDREALIRRETAQLALRPVLRVNGQPTSLKLLEDPRLVIRVEDVQGVATEKEIPGLVLHEKNETLQTFAVPDNSVLVTVTLKAKIQNISRNQKEDLSSTSSFALNGIDRTLAVQDLHVSRTADGYILELRGKNGEPRPGEPLTGWFKHRLFRDEVYTELQTDDQGRVGLGELADIERFRVREPSGTDRTWIPSQDTCTLPDEWNGRVGETLRVPLTFDEAEAGTAVSLLEKRQGQFVRDWGDAVAAADGFIELKGLPAGDYSLFLKPLGRELTVRVTDGEDRDGFILSERRALERPRLAPLQVVAVTAGADTVDIQLANATPFTRVHVLASRYLPAYDLFTRLGFTGTPGLLHQPWPLPQTFYESGRDIGDEYRYILDRQAAATFPGNMLERPGLLLNPWALRDTDAEPERLAGQTDYVSRPAQERRIGRGSYSTAKGESGSAEGYANLDFLQQPAVTLWNRTPDKKGLLRIPHAELQGLPTLRILATDPVSSALKTAALEDTPVETRELRQVAGLDPEKPYAEQKLVTPVSPGETLIIGDATTARFETCDTVAKAYRLLATLGGTPTLEEFSFIATWPALDEQEQRRLYSTYACHELNFFLHEKDPVFFREVIAPYLTNKKDKTFMDQWLLEEDLTAYLEPWRFERLNAVERILLGKRIQKQNASLIRDARERADLIPPNPKEFNRRFDTALQAGGLDMGGDMGAAIEALRESQDRKRMESMVFGGAAISGRGSSVMELDEMMMASDSLSPIIMKNLAPGAMASRSGARRSRPAAMAPPSVELELLEEMPLAAPMDMDAPDEWTLDLLEDLFEDESVARQAAQRRFFQKLDSTKEWAENNYYHLPIEQQGADLVPASAFWADYAVADGSVPFLSPHFLEATRSFTEMMLALAVLDLPFEADEHTEALDGLSYAATAGSPLVIFHREILEAERAEEPGTVLVAQHFFRADDRYRHDGNERFDPYVTEEFLPHVVYGAQVVLTNPQGHRQDLQVLLQIPMGAMPVEKGFYTRGEHVSLEAHGTRTIEYYFYFPATGVFSHYPVTLAQHDEVVGGAAPFAFHVVEQLSNIDKTSWAWISQNGTPEEVITFLDTENVLRLNLNEIAWRMKDKAFFKQVTDLLEARHVYHDTLWSYSLRHNDPKTLSTYLEHSPFADRCGLVLDSPLLVLDPVVRLKTQHLEYAPLVNPRAHPVGAKRKILNASFREQYQRLMAVLSYKAEPTDADKLTVAYYMTLQDRVAEALDWYGRVDRTAVPEQLQCDYLDVYLAFYRGDTDTARRIATQHAGNPVDRWRSRFALALAQLDELETGVAAAAADPESRDQTQSALAATAPALDLLVEAGQIRLDTRNLASCTLNFYPMDIELLFSRNPFLQEGTAQFAFIQPVLSRTIDLPKGQEPLTLDLPAEFKARNVMVEALGAGLRQTQGYYANTLKVQVIEAYGQLLVTHAETGKPVPGTYVKVYAKMRTGEVKFLKDGYTDLRGRFDYVSVNTNEVEQATRLAILILSDEFGAVVRETAPPKR